MMKYQRVIGFLAAMILVLLAIPSASFAADGQQATNTWQKKADMSNARFQFKTEVLGGKIYAIGGRNNSNIINTVEVYDPTTDKWTSLAPMTTARYLFQSEVLNGKIYVVGGQNNSATNTVEVYDPIINKWTSLTSMSKARNGLQTEVINGKIYALGGSDNGAQTNTVEVYDPTTDKWTSLAPMTTARDSFQSEVLNGKIYVVGGQSNSAQTNTVEVYDPTTDKWTSLAPMTTARDYSQSIVFNDKIYVLGGQSSSGGTILNDFEVYNPANNTWTSLTPMSNARRVHQMEVIDGKLYAIGGLNGIGTSSVEAYNLSVNELSAPANLTATSGDTKVELKWDAVVGTTGYNVKRSTTIGGPYTTVSTVSSSTNSFTDTGLTNGTTYYYVITAVSSYSESSNSNEVSATPAGIPIPTNLTATAGDAKVDLKWDAVAGVIGYNIKRSETAGGPYTNVITVSGSAISFSNIGLTNGKTYYYVVTAVTTTGESKNSNEASATPFSTSSITGNKAILVISFNNGREKEYDLTAAEIDKFVAWYDAKSDGTGKSYFALTKRSNVKPFIGRKEYIKFENIESFEIKDYNE